MTPAPRRVAIAGLALAALWSCSKGTTGGPAVPDAAVPAAAKVAAARLDSAKGEVTVKRDGQTSGAQLGPLYIGDQLETGEEGEASIRFPGGRFVEVGPDALMILEQGADGLVLNVQKGLVLTRVPRERVLKPGQQPEAEVSVSIDTPFGLTRIGNSEVSISVGSDSASVDVKIGAVEMVSRNGAISKAVAGQVIALGAIAIKAPILLPTISVMIQAGGKSEVKRKDAKSWVALGKKAQPLGPGDLMRVKDGRTTLTAEGSGTKLVFGRGAEVGFLGAGRVDGLEETELDLKKGELSGTFAAGQKSRVKLGGGLSLVSDSGGQFNLVKTANGFDVNALAGDLALEREGAKPELVKGGQSAKVGAKGLEVSDPTREQLLLPTKSGMKFFQSGASQVSLAWDGEDGKPYRVEVATNPSYTDPLLAGLVHQRFVTVAAPAKGNLYWRVFDGEKEIDHGSASFAPEPQAGGDLDRRRNEVQDGADQTTIYYQDQDKPPTVTFTFDAEPEAVKYKVSVFKDKKFATPLFERSVKDLQLVLDVPLVEGNYQWVVTPFDSKGNGLRGGKMNKLDIAFDNAIPNLIIKAPRNGDPGGASVPVVGIAPVGAKVYVNGKPVDLDDKGRFNSTIAPLPGGRVVFRMVGKNAAEVYTVRTVRG